MSGLQFSSATITPILGNIKLRDQRTYSSPQWSRVVLVQGFSRWQIRAIRKILELLSLPTDWDSYGSRPPTQAAVTGAIQLIMAIDLDNFLLPRVIPVSGGGVQLEWSFGVREIEIEVDDDGLVEYLKTERGRPIEESQIGLADLTGIRSLLMWLTT